MVSGLDLIPLPMSKTDAYMEIQVCEMFLHNPFKVDNQTLRSSVKLSCHQ